MTRASAFFLAFAFLAVPFVDGPAAVASSPFLNERSFRFSYEAVVSKIPSSARRVEV
jgi:hypothetical protein